MKWQFEHNLTEKDDYGPYARLIHPDDHPMYFFRWIASGSFWVAESVVDEEFWAHIAGNAAGTPTQYGVPVTGHSLEKIKTWIGSLNNQVSGCLLSLPTRAQWRQYAFTDTRPIRDQVGRIGISEELQNDLGLWSVHGHVWELCQDRQSLGGHYTKPETLTDLDAPHIKTPPALTSFRLIARAF